MKFSLIAIFAAFLCATAVTGAPSTPNLSFQEFTLANSFGFDDKLRDYWLNIKCIREVLAQESSTQVKTLWAEYKAKLVKLHETEWTKCKGISNIAEQQKCKVAVIEKSITIYSEFFTKLVQIADWQKVREIRKKIAEKCMKHDVFDESEEFTGDSLPAQFQCLVDVLGDVSTKNGLESLWSKSQPQLQLHLDNWKGCAKVESKFQQMLCNIKEGVATYRLITEYLREVSKANPGLVNQIVREVQKKCNAYEEPIVEDLFGLDELDFDILSQNIIEKLKCISGAIKDGLDGTDFAKPWDKLSTDMKKLASRIKACKSESSLLEIAKCVAKETEGAKSVIEDFLKNLRKVNQEAYDRVMEYIKKRCQ